MVPLSTFSSTTQYIHQRKSLWCPTTYKQEQELKNIKHKNNKSRRIIQRHYKRNRIKIERSLNTSFEQKIKFSEKYCLRNYGFVANPHQNLQTNFNKAIRMEMSNLYKQPTNLTFHNLCTRSTIPPGTKQLLGLNLNYCLASQQIPNEINKTILKMANSIRTKYFLDANNTSTNADYIKQIYKRNTTWHPPPAPNLIEEKITLFEKSIKSKQQKLIEKNNKLNNSNLTPIQLRALRSLQNNKKLIIKPTDKNLGPALMELETYVKQVLKEHLLTENYVQLPRKEMERRMSSLKTTLQDIISNSQDQLSKAEITYFKRSLKTHFRLPIFYGLPKVHKTPMSLRPVVSSTNSLLAIFSVWLDYKAKELLPLVESYLKNSATLIKTLQNLHIPDNALLFTADATSMYTNIDIETGLASIRHLLHSNKDKVPSNFPSNLFLTILEIVMQNNIFSFADTFWLQLCGTAMGTPVACSYATLTFGDYENTTLLPMFKDNLLFYRRYIDDILGIWLPSSNNKHTWNKFKEKLNNWGKLKWSLEDPSKQVHFLDLTINLTESSINFSTYQKPLNLYLYIPPLSAHPNSCLKGLIKGEMNRYWLQNNPQDFQILLTKFIERLHARGHTITDLAPVLLQAAASLTHHKMNRKENDNEDSTLYIHWKYHPKGLQ
jgi:hypothetical protein